MKFGTEKTLRMLTAVLLAAAFIAAGLFSVVYAAGETAAEVEISISDTVSGELTESEAIYNAGEMEQFPVTPVEIPDASGSPTYSGTCGDSISWALYSDGDFVIEGTGDVTYSGDAPWNNLILNFKRVIVRDGVTGIPADAFANCPSLTEVILGRDVAWLGYRTFKNCGALKTLTISDALTFSDGYTSMQGTFAGSPLETVNVPATVTSIPATLYNHYSILRFNCEGGNSADDHFGNQEWYFDDNGVLYYYTVRTDKQTLVRHPAD